MKNAEVQEILTNILNSIIEVKNQINKKIPTEQINLELTDKEAIKLLDIQEMINGLLNKLRLIELKKFKKKSTEISTKLPDTSKFLIISSRKAIQQMIENFEIINLEQIVTGGPLETRYFKELNPNIPDHALENIETKIVKIFKKMIKRAKGKSFLVLVGSEDELSDKLLFKSKMLLEKKIKIPIKIIKLEKTSDLTEKLMINELINMS